MAQDYDTNNYCVQVQSHKTSQLQAGNMLYQGLHNWTCSFFFFFFVCFSPTLNVRHILCVHYRKVRVQAHAVRACPLASLTASATYNCEYFYVHLYTRSRVILALVLFYSILEFSVLYCISNNLITVQKQRAEVAEVIFPAKLLLFFSCLTSTTKERKLTYGPKKLKPMTNLASLVGYSAWLLPYNIPVQLLKPSAPVVCLITPAG